MNDFLALSLEDQANMIFKAAIIEGVLHPGVGFNSEEIKEAIRFKIEGGTSTANIELDGFITEYFDRVWIARSDIVDESMGAAHVIWTRIEGFFITMFSFVWSGFKGVFNAIVRDSILDIKKTLTPYDGDKMRESFAGLVKAGILDEAAIDEFERMFGETKLTETLLPLVGVAAAIIEGIKTIFNTAGGDFGKRMLRIFTPMSIPPEQLIRLGFIAPGQSKTVREKLAENGYSEEDQNLMFAGALNMLDVQYIRDLYLRKEMDSNTVYVRMRQVGYTDDRTAEIMKTWEAIPSAQDLLFMVGKEAFEPDMVREFGYDDEFPAEQAKWMEAQGLSDYWQKRYWYAHWSPPSIQLGFEMLHRRVIGDHELEQLFKTVEVPPYWRDKLKEISYKPYTRVDVRRMEATGVLGEQDVFEAYLDLGYDENKALKMTEFTIQFNQDADRELTRGQIETYYKNNLIDHATALQYLLDIGYTADRSDYFLAYQDYEKEQDFVEDVVSNTGEMYMTGIIEYDNAQARLYEVNLPAKRVTTLFDKWNIRIYKDRKLPSKTDLDKFYKAGLIELLDYSSELAKLGYPEKYIALYSALLESQGR